MYNLMNDDILGFCFMVCNLIFVMKISKNSKILKHLSYCAINIKLSKWCVTFAFGKLNGIKRLK